MESTTLLTVVFSVVGLILTIVNTWAQAERQAGSLYDQMVRFRIEHPEIMSLSRRWQPGFFEKVYSQERPDAESASWILYYSYVELCLSYCNTVLASWWRFPPASYRHHHRPLVILTLTEHNPIIEDLMNGPYLSNQIRQFRKFQSEAKWREKHLELAS